MAPEFLKNIRMIALDLDGTLLRSDKTIGPRTRDALHAAHAQGVVIVLASGRMTPAMERAAENLGLDVCLVSYNGAAICDRRANFRRRLFHKPLETDVAQALFKIGKQRRYQINFYYQDVILSEDAPHLRPYIEIYRSRTGSPFRFVERLEDYLQYAPTKFIYIVDPAIRNALEDELRPSFGTRATILRTDPEYLEFLNPTVDKGRSVVRLAENLGIRADQIMALGDGDNDITMLASVGWGVAVANAGVRCKAVAHAITEHDNDHDGVAEAVERWVL
ncbi:MAG: Cof-type HAD-IIB family hydrolase [Planctomycetota bacterium]